MRNKGKAMFLTTMFTVMFLSILYFITFAHPDAWKWYGIIFGILGVVYFVMILYRWIAYEPAERIRRG